MINLRLIFVISLFATILTFSASASTILCDSCNTAAMRESAKAQATTRIPGTYTIAVLNITNADYNAYQAIVQAGGPPGTPVIAITQQSSAKEAQVEAAATDLQLAIGAYKKTAAKQIVLPAHSPYQSAANALTEKAAFATYATHVVRTQHKALQQKTNALNASVRQLVTIFPVEYVNIAATVRSPALLETWVVFPDRSEIKVQMTLQYNLADGLVPVVTVAP